MWPLRDPLWPNFTFFSIIFPVVNLSVKFDANIFINDRCLYGYFTTSLIWLRNAYSRPFWGYDPLNIIGYCGDPQKAHPWPETRVLAYRLCLSPSIKKCDLGARWRNQKKEKKLRDVRSHRPDLPRPPTWRYPTKVVIWGGVPDVVNRAKFCQNRLRGFGSLRGRNLPFSYAWRYGLYNRLGLPLNLWYNLSVTFCSVPFFV